MADITTFTSRESVIHAAFQALEKEGINISFSFPKDASFPDTEEVVLMFYVHVYVCLSYLLRLVTVFSCSIL